MEAEGLSIPFVDCTGALGVAATEPTCDECGVPIPYAATQCVFCGFSVGFPNVRAAECSGEVEALHERVRQALVSADARKCRAELEEFGTAVSGSSAVIACKLVPLSQLILASNAMMSTYYKMVEGGARLPENNGLDMVRGPMDAKVNPHDVHREISFAALSLDGRGVQWYGDYWLTIRSEAVTRKASVFEENPLTFCDRHTVSVTKPLPPGYRASWVRRSELAMAKLHPRIKAGMGQSDFPGVLMEQGTNSETSDFIEVHIYGPIHPKAVGRVVAKPPTARSEIAIWKKIKKRLIEMGAEVEEV